MLTRKAALRVLERVFSGEKLESVLVQEKEGLSLENQKLLSTIVYGVLRYKSSLQWQLQQLRQAAIKEHRVQLILLIGLYQLRFLRVADHAAVHTAVELCKHLHFKFSARLVNGILRRYQREQAKFDDLLQQQAGILQEHPSWLIKRLKKDWGAARANAVIAANNTPAMMILCNNPLRQSCAAYIEQLQQKGIAAQAGSIPNSIVLVDAAVSQHQLPNWEQGSCMVQGLAAQAAVHILQPTAHETVIDVCAAPGNKLLQIKQQFLDVEASAIEINPYKADYLQRRLAQQSMQLVVQVGDARSAKTWGDRQYQAILLDAPCSAVGAIRRHPDIKWSRTGEQVRQMVALQQELLETAWQHLQVGGRLLYATCSTLKAENSGQMRAFIAKHAAQPIPIDLPFGFACDVGWQVLPNKAELEGFYYCLLGKEA